MYKNERYERSEVNYLIKLVNNAKSKNKLPSMDKFMKNSSKHIICSRNYFKK